VNVLQILDERWDSAITEYGLSLASVLKSRGHSVFVAARRGSHAAVECGRRDLPLVPADGWLALRRAVRRDSIQVVNSHTGSGHLLGWWATAGRDVALVRTRGDARPLHGSPGRRFLYRRTDAVVSVSRCIAVEYQSAFPEAADRQWTVYPGFPAAAWEPEPAGPVRVALVGRLDPVKGQSDFIEAVAALKPRLSDQRFVVSGEAKNTSVDELRRLAERRGVSRWVEFQGRQSDVLAFMRSCHAGVVASVGSEALSRVCLEWMSQGRPVAATAVGCLPELVSTGDNGFLVPPRSPRALANALQALIEQEEFRRRLGRRAHETAASRFSLERLGADTEKVYQEALRRRLQRGGAR
jgi:glycosyltransferase involved in cell wall biosynthesis